MPMNLQRVDFYVLDVGQGACNYVELIDAGGAIAYNMLLDLGTNSSFAVATANIAWLQGRLAARPKPTQLDVLVLTHGDTDHFNMVSRILPAMDPPTRQNIGMVRFGGPRSRYTAYRRSLIDKLELYSSNVDGFLVPWSSYNSIANTWTPIWPTGATDATDALLYVFLANMPHAQDHTLGLTDRKKHNAVAVNAKSVVFGVYWNQRLLVGTGDATAATFAGVNGHIPVLSVPTVMMTMPHHGSRNTTFDLANATLIPDGTAINVVNTFLNIFKPVTISISADEKGHHHPSLITIDLFSKVTATSKYWSDPNLTGNRHYLTAWVDWNIAPTGQPAWPAAPQYNTLQTATNLYSTLYHNATITVPAVSPPVPCIVLPPTGPTASPRGKNWLFSVGLAGTLTVAGYDNIRPVSTRLASFAAAPAAAAPSRNAGARLARPSAPGFTRAGLRRTAPPARPVPAATATLRGLKPLG